MNPFIFLIVLCCALLGCQSSKPSSEKGPDGTVVYKVPVDSTEPNTRIEVNGDFIGIALLSLTIFGDEDGSFHNFGSYDYVVKAIPPGKDPKAIYFRTGVLFGAEDRVPERIHFDYFSNTTTQPTPK